MSLPQKNAHWLWLIAPSVFVGFAMLVLEDAWMAMVAFHLIMIAALIIHRDSIDWRKSFARPPTKTLALHFVVALLVMAGFSVVLFAYANRHVDYGQWLDARLSDYAVAEPTRIWFAAQLCLLNPLLEELFWRGRFFHHSKRPVATDVAYAAYHFFALQAFMPIPQAVVGTIGLVGVGYTLRQFAARCDGSLAIGLLWHALGDIAVVVALARLMAG